MTGYRGRFAPTPSGPLHFGSLYTALASWLDARAAGGRWLLRIDDLDAARCHPQHTTTILHQLEAHGLIWDESPRLASRHIAEYRAALERLRRDDRLYYCRCTRKRLARIQFAGPDGSVYPGYCRESGFDSGALRLRTTSGQLELNDLFCGNLLRDAAREIGDFVVCRADGIPGYQLHCAIDEAAQRITRVMRGADLLGSTVRQRIVAAALRLPSPHYAHLPLVVDVAGYKLSKHNHAQPIDASRAIDNLRRALVLLEQPAPEPALATPADILAFAVAHWRPARIGSSLGRITAPFPIGLQTGDLALSTQRNHGG
ncbi:MAG: tRNA glutamyl-Q(34) synthetase GluQRS [Gammaproteobacteria bacterium]|nr:tRNA glutamyl-Q(34) synthetase GluQRS [Gammaproteobacteria bacterium]